MPSLQAISSRGARTVTFAASLAAAVLAVALSSAAASGQPAAPAEAGTPAAAKTAVRHARIPLATGVELHVAEAGPADGEPVLFLHGYTDSWFAWTPVLEKLPANIRAIVPSQRGHGDSGRPECCYRYTDFAADAIALLDALGIERATIVGHSMGSFTAQRMAIEHPQRVTRLVLVGSGATMQVPAVDELAAALESLVDADVPSFAREFQSSMAPVPLPQAFFEGVVAETAKLPAPLLRRIFDALLAGDAADELHRIKAPTLVIWGRHDMFWPRSQQDALLRRLPDARLIVYEDAGHAPNWQQPERFVADLVAFLDEDPRALLRAPNRFLALDDVVLRYRDLGGTGEPVVLLHGYTDELEAWGGIADSLASDYRVIAVDLRGFGASRATGTRYGSAMADDIIALVDSLDIAPAHFVGYSLGALVATTIATVAPERVASLTLLGPPLYVDSATADRELAPFVTDLRNGAGLQPFFQWVYPEAPADAMRRAAQHNEVTNDPVALVETLRQIGALVPDSVEVADIADPTLIVVGTEDPFVVQSRYAAATLQEAELIEVAGGDHAITLRRPSWIPEFRELTNRSVVHAAGR